MIFVLISSALVSAVARTIHFQYASSECFGFNSDPGRGGNRYFPPIEPGPDHQCYQEWCPNKELTKNCVLRDNKEKFVGIAQFDVTMSYHNPENYNKHNKNQRAQTYSETSGVFFFQQEHSAVTFIWPFIPDTGTIAYNNGFFSFNTISGSGDFLHVGTSGMIDIQVTQTERFITLHLPAKKDNYQKNSYGDSYGSDHQNNNYGSYGQHQQQLGGTSAFTTSDKSTLTLHSADLTGTWLLTSKVGVNQYGPLTSDNRLSLQADADGIIRGEHCWFKGTGNDPDGEVATSDCFPIVGVADLDTREIYLVETNEIGTLRVRFCADMSLKVVLTQPGLFPVVQIMEFKKVSDAIGGEIFQYAAKPEL